MQARLRAIGLRPISALVDITNYFTMGLNRPLHVFDAAKVSGTLHIRPAAQGETLLALDGKTYTLAPGQMVIADDNGPESLAGIMGGEHSGVTEATTDVFLESAYWDPITIAATGRALKINSDARYRFERGVDPAFTLPGLHAATQMILDICGGEASSVTIDGAAINTTRQYKFDAARVGSLVGMDIPESTQRQTLTALGFVLNGTTATPPTWRPDVQGEADLVEEIARIASLSKLVGKPLPRARAGVPAPILTPAQIRERAARRTLAALGYNECVTYSFIDQTSATLFGVPTCCPASCAPPPATKRAVSWTCNWPRLAPPFQVVSRANNTPKPQASSSATRPRATPLAHVAPPIFTTPRPMPRRFWPHLVPLPARKSTAKCLNGSIRVAPEP